jgi:hypothetical protein
MYSIVLKAHLNTGHGGRDELLMLQEMSWIYSKKCAKNVNWKREKLQVRA